MTARALWRGFVGLLASWLHRHRERRLLAELGPQRLTDLGLSRMEADREGRKPFWES